MGAGRAYAPVNNTSARQSAQSGHPCRRVATVLDSGIQTASGPQSADPSEKPFGGEIAACHSQCNSHSYATRAVRRSGALNASQAPGGHFNDRATMTVGPPCQIKVDREASVSNDSPPDW
jgi:hypothetical protein